MPGPFLLFRNLLIQTRPHWDRSETRPAVRSAFAEALQCRTPELGAEVFASDNEEQGAPPSISTWTATPASMTMTSGMTR